jgi:general secretion pathway protein D
LNRKKSTSLIFFSLLLQQISLTSVGYAQDFEEYNAPTDFDGGGDDFIPPPNDFSSGDSGGLIPPPINNSDDFDTDFGDADSFDGGGGGGGLPGGSAGGNASGGGSSVARDNFGRRTGTPPGTTSVDQKKYVTLNPETAFGPEVVESFDFPDVSLADLTKHMQKLTGINLISEKDIKGRTSIVAPTPITVGDAWKAYLEALNMNGYSLVKSGAFYKIVNHRDIRYTATKIYTGEYSPNTENYVMRIFPIKHINAEQVRKSFMQFMTRHGRIYPVEQTNTLIIQDTGTNINRLSQLIKMIDVPGYDESLQIIPVKNSSAQEIAKLLEQIIMKNNNSRTSTRTIRNGAKDSENITRIIAEPRTNSIIAMANANGAKQLRDLIGRLDVSMVDARSGQIHVYYLNHGNAEDLSKTLSTLVTNAQQRRGSAPTSRFSLQNNESSQSLFSSDVKITADKANNALVVTAGPTDYLTIKEVISKLDIPRDQVYVEAMIMETEVGNARGFGINVVGGYGRGSAELYGYGTKEGGSDLINLLTSNITSLGGLFVGGGAGQRVQKTLPNGSKIEIRGVNALIKAVATDANTNVLATPQILAYDNTEAEFEVGEKIPVPKTSTATNGTTTNDIGYEQATLKLKITPQIKNSTKYPRHFIYDATTKRCSTSICFQYKKC